MGKEFNKLHNPDSDKPLFDDDPELAKIKSLENPEEVAAAQELFLEKINAPEKKDTALEEKEPETPEKEKTDTSLKPEDKTEDGKKPAEPTDKDKPASEKEPVEGEFVLTDELIQKQPKEFHAILEKYKGKGKDEIAKATANAIALKNPVLRGNQKAIDAIAEGLLANKEEELLTQLIESQARTGENEQKPAKLPEPKPAPKIELPNIPETGEMKVILDRDVIKRMKKKYPDMPDDMSGEEYLDWRRDLNELNPDNTFKDDLVSAKADVKKNLSKIVYAQLELKNLLPEDPGNGGNPKVYDESLNDLLGRLTEENLPILKELNDNYVEVNNRALEDEIKLIEKEVQKYGVPLTELGIDLALTKDEKGSFYNENLYGLIVPDGKNVDPDIVRFIGRIPTLRKGILAQKFIIANLPKITTALVKNENKIAEKNIEKLKDETLKTISSKSTPITSTEKVDNINEVYDPAKLKEILDKQAAKIDQY